MLYAKVLNPAKHGKVVYANTGSARRATNYLQQEAKQQGRGEAAFFGSEADVVLRADQVVELLDGNHKGLGKDAAKFYSFVLSPDQEQLALLGNDPQKLQEFTRVAVEIYAGNYNLKGGQQLHEKDIVWVATIHTERTSRSSEPEKEGLQTHVHVLVSARDKAQKITLNPLGTADRFNRVAFQAAVGIELDLITGQATIGEGIARQAQRQHLETQRAEHIQSRAKSAKKELTPEQLQRKEGRLDVQVARVNAKLPADQQLDPTQVKEVARERTFDDVFYKTLGKIERRAEAYKPTIDPLEYLRTGRVQRGTQLDDWQPQAHPPRLNQQLLERLREPPAIEIYSSVAVIERRINELARALETRTKSQDVRSEEERVRDRGYER